MMTQTWTIGSGRDCELIVDHPTVSGRHCRLTVDDNKLFLEDLNSTNGTFVNGVKLLTAREVRITDRITLGMTQLMPWPLELKPVAKPAQDSVETYAISRPDSQTVPVKTVITIGRGSQNAVVLNDPNISTQHARLTITPEQIILEDLGSTNGTAVGTVENKILCAEVSVGDPIFLGSSPFTVADLLQKQTFTKKPKEAKPPQLAPPTPPVPVPAPAFSPQPWIIGGISTVALVLIGWIVFGRGNSSSPIRTTRIEASSTQGSGETVQSVRATPEPAISPEQRLQRALFVIVAADRERKTPFRVGTAFAIDDHHVATAASVISALENLQQNGFPEAFLYCPETKQEVHVTNTVVHAAYHDASQAARSAQAEYESIMDQYEADPPPPEKLESIKTQLIALQEKALLAFDRKTTYDVAVVATNESLPYWLSGVESGSSLRPNLKLQVQGLPHDLEDPFFDPQSLAEPEMMTSRVRQTIRISADAPPRLLADAIPEQRELAYFGSPALNSRGEVVAIYSRPTPPATEAEMSDLPTTFDAPLFDRVRECLKQQP